MKNVKKIYESFGRGKQQLILRQELLPILIRFDDVVDDTEKNRTFRLSEIFIDWFDTDVVKLTCVKETELNKEIVSVLVPYASIPAILLKRTDLAFDVIVQSPLCVGDEKGKRVFVGTRVEIKCISEKRRYRLDTDFKTYIDKNNEDRKGCTYSYPYT